MTEPVEPTPAQLEAFAGADQSAPVCMVNLLKFREHAEYPDGRDARGLSGRDAYGLYGAVAMKKIAEVGGKFLWGAPCEMTFVGDGRDDWDMIAIVYYPSRAAFLRMVAMPGYLEASEHRRAGLLRTALIQCPGNIAQFAQ